ncbi:hypothetical protein CH063_00174, partial [Colletotrichum higginsianum]
GRNTPAGLAADDKSDQRGVRLVCLLSDNPGVGVIENGAAVYRHRLPKRRDVRQICPAIVTIGHACSTDGC